MLNAKELQWSKVGEKSRQASWGGFKLYIQLRDDSYQVLVAPPESYLGESAVRWFTSPEEAVEWAGMKAEEWRSMGPGKEYHHRQKLLNALDDCLGIKSSEVR